MRIAVFYNLPVSGAKRVVYEHVKGLMALGHTVDVYTLNKPGDLFDPIELANNSYQYKYKPFVIPFPFFKKVTHDLSDFFLLKNLHKKIAREIDKNGYDVALLHTDAITQAPFVLHFLKTKNVYFCLEPLRIANEYALRIKEHLSPVHLLYENINRSIRKKIDRDNARAATQTTSISYFGRELMIQAFDLYPRIQYLGVNTKIFKKLSVKKKNQILFIGQKLQVNGYDVAQQAIAKIPKKIRPELKILSFGGTKRLTDKEVVNLYNESLMTLCLSTFDTFGLVALESLACQTSVIAFNVAGYRETMIDNQTGFLVDFGVDELTEKIITLIKTPTLAKQMGENGRKWVEKEWTWESKIKELEKLLISLKNS